MILKKIKSNIGLFLILYVTNNVLAAETEIKVVASEPLVSAEESLVVPEVQVPQIFEAKDIVLTFQGELIEIMQQGDELGFYGRYDRLKLAILKSHDLKKIARIVVGREWKKLSNEQKRELIDVFSQLSISAYAHNFKAFSGESFDFVSEDETARGGKIVRTTFVLPKDKNVKFDYMLKKKGDNWRIINIIANGVSDLALKRSEYTSVLKRKGFDALIAKITEKINNYAQQ